MTRFFATLSLRASGQADGSASGPGTMEGTRAPR